jgi:hypothetical protein
MYSLIDPLRVYRQSLPLRDHLLQCIGRIKYSNQCSDYFLLNKGNNKITELRTILQRESQNS